MNRLETLREEVSIQLDFMSQTVDELVSLHRECLTKEPTNRDKAAAAAFLSQFYNGVENILKRICYYHAIALPATDTWHIDLFNWFRSPSHTNLPVLFDEDLGAQLENFRKFRPVVRQGYSFQLDWTRLSGRNCNSPNSVREV